MVRKDFLSTAVLCLLFSIPFHARGQEITTSDPSAVRNPVSNLSPAQELCVVITDKLQNTPEVQYAPPVKPKYWKRGVITQFGLSEVSLTHWAAGGYGSIALNAYINAYANYSKDKTIWNNDFQVGYGFINSFTDDGFKKSDDRFIINSKWGYQMIKTLYFSAVYNYNMTMFPGYKNSNLVSHIFSPAYTSLGLGIDWNPVSWVSLNLAPLTGKIVFVADSTLRTLYGNDEDELAHPEFGAQIKMDNKFVLLKNIQCDSKLTLFSDYFNKPQNIVVNWDVSVDGKLTKNISYSIRTNLIYDDNIKFLDSPTEVDEDGNPVKIPGIQFKQVCGLSLTYTFGDSK
ncbi:MAG: DUF3078 domain-containing protein [Bacteroidales bacterium]|jgi:hypothetical protein|nr:DUF3078 domain-containing protein [Bacteroidales bacterium]MCI2121345.1 DUF3078 domain-containing protein [Bacteroidales bacterium]MCI2145254.1 DUF3078 domain-containing protein [Bacteroidales bacterium]